MIIPHKSATTYKTPIVLNDDTNYTQHRPLTKGSECLPPTTIPLSNASGNRLTMYDDGIYYGNVAPPDISNLYISTTLGNDNNPGTRDKPLRTLDKLSDILSARNPYGVINVFLRCGEVFKGTKQLSLGNGVITLALYFYDDPVFGDINDAGAFRVWLDNRIKHPKIIFDTYFDPNDNLIKQNSFQSTLQSSIIYSGVDIDINDSIGKGTSIGAWYIYNYISDFRGSKITFNANLTGYGSSTIITLQQATIEINGLDTRPDKKIFLSDQNPIISCQKIANAGDIIKDPNGKYPDIIAIGTNVKQVLKPENTMANAAYDVNTKSQFGYTTTWDQFITYTNE